MPLTTPPLLGLVAASCLSMAAEVALSVINATTELGLSCSACALAAGLVVAVAATGVATRKGAASFGSGATRLPACASTWAMSEDCAACPLTGMFL